MRNSNNDAALNERIESIDWSEQSVINGLTAFIRRQILPRQVQGRILKSQKDDRSVLESTAFMIEQGQLKTADEIRAFINDNSDKDLFGRLQREYVQKGGVTTQQ